ncbi:hypothetical protein MKX03_026800 [Papaver bracteatum]|nr:hypothetical protein MKX03_026800 [Papaver bracteatum]
MAISPFFKSKYLPTVCLEDWWLAKSEDGKRLCMGGLDVSENRARRVFSSAPITKRCNLVTLKTADSINILIKGTINHSRSQENGFSSEDCGVPEGTRENEDNYKLSNDANLSDVINMIPPIDLQSSCEKFESSKTTSQGDKKTTTNLKSVGPENLRRSYDTGADEVVKDAQASIGSESSDVKNADPYEDTSTKLAKAKGVITKGKVGREGINSHSISGDPDCGYEAIVDVPVESWPINMQSLIAQIHVKEDLIHGSEGNLDGSVSETPVAASPSVSERSESCSYHTMEESTLQRLPKANVSCSVEVGLNTLKAAPSKGAATRIERRIERRLTKTEGKGNKNRASNCCNENINSIPGPRLEAFASSCNIDCVKENVSSSNGGRASGRIKKRVNNLNDDQSTNSKIQHEREKANFVSVGSDSVKSYVANADGELGGSSTPDEPNHYSKDGLHTDLMHSSVPTGAAEKIISESGIDGAEVGDMRKSFTSLHKVGDVKDASDLVSKEREESKHSQLETLGSKTMKKDVPSLPSSGSKKKKQYSNARECPNLNLKRSRSGRLFTPPQFWRDQQLMYDKKK